MLPESPIALKKIRPPPIACLRPDFPEWLSPMLARPCLIALLLLLPAALTHALSYQAAMNHAEWLTSSSPFECKLWQPIPFYGDAVFQHEAGTTPVFFLAPQQPDMRRGKASLKVKPPVWDAQRPVTELGYVAVTESLQPIRLDEKLSTRLLTELYEGMAPEFTRRSRFADDVTVNVQLSSVNFRRAYRQYRDCLAQLLPVNFEQIARSRLHFETAQWELTPAARERLDLVVRYVKADSSVSGFYIDGYTDDVGRRLYNLELSRKRAETVTRYLIANGVDEALITTRYHGERYPVAKNDGPANRAKNRRVTLRLERDGF